MSTALLEIAFLAISYCSSTFSEPIVGGIWISKNDITKYPCVVSLQEKGKGSTEFRHFCGGSLISHNWILSAAHCVHEKNTKNIVAVIGAENLLSKNVVKHPVVKCVLNNFLQYSLRNDIALIKIKTDPNSVAMDEHRFAKLPINIKEPLEPRFCVILGYGANKYGGIIPNTLYAANVTLMTNEACRSVLGNVMAPTAGDNKICAIGNGTDTCQGDSGGPLICSQNGKAFIYGIVNYGLNCGLYGVPSIYTIVGRYLTWIQNETSTMSFNKTTLP